MARSIKNPGLAKDDMGPTHGQIRAGRALKAALRLWQDGGRAEPRGVRRVFSNCILCKFGSFRFLIKINDQKGNKRRLLQTNA